MRQIVGLLVALATSMVVLIALSRWSESFGWPRWPTLARNTFRDALILTVCVVCALVPRRGIVGAALVIAFSILRILGERIAGTAAPFSAWKSVEDVSLETAHVLFVFVILQGFRLFCGWRIAALGDPVTPWRGQFQVAELLEWMLSCGILLGLNSLSGSWATSSAGKAATVFVSVGGLVLFGLPATYWMLARRLGPMSFVQSALWGTIATVIWTVSQGLYVRLSVVLALWPQAAWAGVLLWCCLTIHLLALRWLGYRWSVGAVA